MLTRNWWRPPGQRLQAVARVGATNFEQLDAGFTVGLAGRLDHAEKGARIFHDAAAMDARKRLHAGAGRDRLIGLGDGALAKQRMVGVARGGLDGEQRQARGFAVDAVDRRQVLDAEAALQAHQQALLHIASGGCDRRKWGLSATTSQSS
jgi:hypothetical protein